jgi:hypothetical protein
MKEIAMSRFKHRILLTGVLLLFILACNLPQPTPPVDAVNASTAAALTVAAAINDPQQNSPLASATLSAPIAGTFTPLPTLSPTLSYTATSSVPLISVSVDTNCRLGTGKAYDRVGGLLVGETAEVVAKDPTGEYWYIRDPESPTGFCWVWGYYATVVGNTSAIPVFTPPPSPTPSPSFTLSYAGIDSCVGWWAELRIKNTGPIAFKSFSLTIKDRTQNVTLSDSGNGFTDLDGCLSSAITAVIDSGDTYVISSPAFVNNIVNHNMRATLTLCTGLNQGGTCITETIDFRP